MTTPTPTPPPKRTTAQIRAEIELERQGLVTAVGELRTEAGEAADQAKRVGIAAAAAVAAFGVVRALLRFRG